jgi:histone-binding protein RBBP4
LVTGNEDTTVKTWDIKSGFSKSNKTISPTATYNVHSATVNDVQYHPIHNFLIGTASDDLTWQIIDTRMETHKKALYRKEAHDDAVNCISFHPEFEGTFATGSADKSVGIWDMRNFDKKLHSLQNHASDVIGLQWHPQDAAILASSSYDRRICLWDLSKICDFDWNKNDPWLMMGAAEDNQLQIFRPARKLVEPIKKTVNHGDVSD